ncbi:tigger transposable element-derived protein 2-like [Cotesia glomerata]|uniref:tigger transposable element-derived protein 2-like n=1 Tax=Cotesia glomerata TaxID=32391 RepID=UPI001D006B56|nr:tigger transposable element-derived protein 2-like [Cotesia glomerata]
MLKQKLEFIRTTKVIKFPIKKYNTTIRQKKILGKDNKPQQRRFSVAEKLEILKELDTGTITMTELADRNGVSRAAIYKIKHNRENLSKYANNISNRAIVDKKRTKSGHPLSEILDEILFAWLCQNRQLGLPLSGPYICEMALEVNRIIGGIHHFKASQGWLSSFKKRHGMKRSKVLGEKLSIDTNRYAEYQEDYIKIDKNQDYKIENIYIGDEGGLNWKSLPGESSKNSVTKNKVTILFCANANGSFRLPPLIIGPSKKPCTVRGKKPYPVTYAAQKSSRMEQIIFTDWYKNHFIPFVKNKQQTKDPVLLIIDNCPVHPPVEELNEIDPQFHVVKVYSKVTPVTDLLHRHVIQKTKIMYRKKLLREIASSYEKSNDPDVFLNNFKIIDACYMMASTWQELSKKDLAATWSKLKKSYELAKKSNAKSFQEAASETFEYDNTAEFIKLLKNIPACEKCNHEDVRSWLKDDFFDQGWEPLKLKSIAQQVLDAHNIIIFDETCEDTELIDDKFKDEYDSDEKISEDSDDYTDFASLDDTIDVTKPEFLKSAESNNLKSEIMQQKSTPESDSMDCSNLETLELETDSNMIDVLEFPIRESMSDSDVTDISKSENQKLNPDSLITPLDENTLKAVDTIRRWYKLNANSKETIVRNHLEALQNMENYITTHIVSNYC